MSTQCPANIQKTCKLALFHKASNYAQNYFKTHIYQGLKGVN